MSPHLAHQLWVSEGPGVPVLLIPGLGQTGAAWQPVASNLHHRPLATVDPLGAGKSDQSDRAYEPELHTAALLGVLDELGWQSAHLVGLSMGGMLAQELALAAPDRVASLCLVCTYGATDPWSRRLFELRRKMIADQSLADQFALAIHLVTSPRTFRNHQPTIDAFERAFAESPPPQHAYLHQIDYCMNHNALERLHQIEAPTLVVSGGHDFLTSAQQGRELADAIPTSEFVEYSESSHALIYEETERFLKDLSSFLLRAERLDDE